MKLIDYLKNFKGAASEDKLTEEFKRIAPRFLYGGYIKVGDSYHIYIHTIEFYFHAEEGCIYNIKDPIVYHRNEKYPYYPTMSLHAHASGYDITFENETMKYRASALIRAYAIFDVSKGDFLEPQKTGRHWDDRSTYLYDYINGFTIDGKMNIEWIDKELPLPHSIKNPTPRRNVFIYENGKRYKKDTRPWCFSREKDINKYDIQ